MGVRGVVIVATILIVAGGCNRGGSKELEEVPAKQWATAFCDGYVFFSDDAVTLTESLASLRSEATDAMQVDEVADATRESVDELRAAITLLSTALKDAGAPAVESGRAVIDAVRRHFERAKKDLDEAEEALADVGDDRNAVRNSIDLASKALDEVLAARETEDREVRSAMRASSSCRRADEELAPVSG